MYLLTKFINQGYIGLEKGAENSNGIFSFKVSSMVSDLGFSQSRVNDKNQKRSRPGVLNVSPKDPALET